MLHIISVLIAGVVAVGSESTSLTDDRQSPPMVAKPDVTKVEIPAVLADDFLVDDPSELLETLRDTQQAAWSELKSFKVRAWYQFQNNRGPKPVTWLIDYSHVRAPAHHRELKFNSEKMMLEAKAGRKYLPVGIDADDKDAWYCLNAQINTPDMNVSAMFTKHMRPDNHEMLTISPPTKTRSTRIIEETARQFGFAMSPKEFYDVHLPRVIKAGGKLVVKQKGNIVELDYTDPAAKRLARKIYRFDMSKHGSAIASWDRAHRRETELQNLDNIWVPHSIKEQNMNRYIEMTFFDWTINTDLSGEFSVKTLPMAERTVVVDKRVSPRVQTYFRDWED